MEEQGSGDATQCRARPTLRKDKLEDEEIPQDWLLGKLLNDLEPKKGAQLPTNGEVLRMFLYLNRGPMKKEKKDYVITTVIEKVGAFWHLAGIPTTSIKSGHSHKRVNKLITNYDNIRKHKGRKNFPDEKDAFLKSLDLLFDISHKDAVTIIEHDRCRTKNKIAEDIQFLEDQRTIRKMELGSLDKAHFKKVQRRLSRVEQLDQRAQREQQRQRLLEENIGTVDINLDRGDLEQLALVADGDSHEDEGQGKESLDPDFAIPSTSSVNRPKRSSSLVTLNLPRNPFKSTKISAMGDRLNLSAGQRTAFMGAILSEGGVHLEIATLSVTSTWSAGKEIRKAVAEEIKAKFIPPKHAAIHWDGKLVSDINKESKERLGILVSGMPEYEEGKLLGVPVITNSTGEEQANATWALVKEWGICEHVRALVFDTTASNSGWKIGACVKLETCLDKKLLMLACRHHIFERILCAVHKDLFGKTSGPENPLFVHFRDSIWKTVDTKQDFKTLLVEERPLKLRMANVTQSLKRILSPVLNTKQALPRDDYRECAELMLMLLGTKPERGEHWLRPGACHHARWMPSILYPAKMFAFSAQVGYDKDMVTKLERLCKFNALFYVEKWLSASVGADAPWNDLKLWHDLCEYRKYDHEVANAALQALDRHYWYLTEECSVFSVFSNRLSDAERQQIAKQLGRTPRPNEFERGHPTFPILNQNTKLVNLIGPKSWFLFDAMGIGTAWLKKPFRHWHLDPDYQEAEMFVRHVKVVNDVSERAVKLIQDFSTTITNDELQKQYLLQVVEHQRKSIPNFKKSTLINL